jgi:hypothetical protein
MIYNPPLPFAFKDGEPTEPSQLKLGVIQALAENLKFKLKLDIGEYETIHSKSIK